jgi:hypothetical protein
MTNQRRPRPPSVKNAVHVERGKLGDKTGGAARDKALSPEQRLEMAKMAPGKASRTRRGWIESHVMHTLHPLG